MRHAKAVHFLALKSWIRWESSFGPEMVLRARVHRNHSSTAVSYFVRLYTADGTQVREYGFVQKYDQAVKETPVEAQH